MGLEDRLVEQDAIGEGGMSVVSEVFDTNLMRVLACKTVRSELRHNEEVRRRMIEEAQITAQLDHPNILPVHELGLTPAGSLFFTMKRVTGRTLAALLAEQPPTLRSDAELLQQLHYFIRVCDAVAFAHERNVIHRDLKPDNVMVGRYHEVYLMDWGIARVLGRDDEPPPEPMVPEPPLDRTGPFRRRYVTRTRFGTSLGTPHYMAPEQARGELSATDQRSDVFSLGAILFEILTGRPPHLGETALAVLVAAARCEVPWPQDVVEIALPPRLCHIASRALHPEPDERYQSAVELRDAVDDFLQSGWQFPLQVFDPGELIIREGEQGDTAYIVASGRCRVLKQVDGRPVVLSELTRGEVFGETAVFGARPRTASVEAVDRVTVRMVTRKHFTNELGMGLWLGRFVKALARRFEERNRAAAELEQRLDDVRVRLALMEQLALHAHTTPDGRRWARWKRIRDHLALSLACTPTEITEQVCLLAGVTVAEEEGVVILDEWADNTNP